VNRALIDRGKGHALTHEVHGHGHDHQGGGLRTGTLAVGVVAFLLGGLVVSIADELEQDPEPTPHVAVQTP
jgi:hypothetical protein